MVSKTFESYNRKVLSLSVELGLTYLLYITIKLIVCMHDIKIGYR